MGIHGSSTCVMNFDNTTGYLIGEEQEGLHQMFTFMNTARIGTALQGLCASELGYQGKTHSCSFISVTRSHVCQNELPRQSYCRQCN